MTHERDADGESIVNQGITVIHPGEQPELDGTNDKASLRFLGLGRLVGSQVWCKFTGPQIGNVGFIVGRDTSISIDSPKPAQGSLIDASSDGDWPLPKEGAKTGTAPDAGADEGGDDADPFAITDLARK